ncbi:hypothetical protein L207DRAFT_481871 [Hyaloscypha variabilis F]|uniref:Uncharacterized protein n=1 Tax=Hyaloscypha variabilis (strain UAMH 11265 / GT02V1 / F) TaxID=1149755 RepID=A0A2J6S3Z7_HYAVF|nr:hypothetical protein L207DRAFT_481871 [Hyaloscypha variabilis F]
MRIPLLSFVLLAVCSTASAVLTLTSTGCVDAAGFQTCQNGVTAASYTCLNASTTQTETLACGCSDYVGNYNCYSAYCWNRVNECEYQEYVVEYLVGCPIAKLPVPYFPTPDNAPDSCSCNVGDVYLAISSNIQQGGTCSTNVSNSSPDAAVQEIQGCECCEVSGALSSIYAICPNTDPTLIGLSSVQQLETTLDTQINDCQPYLAEYNCVSDLGFSQVVGNIFYGPNNLPASGTQTLSNVAGTVTAPASGGVFTYTNGGDGQVYTISAASVKAGSGGGATTTGKGAASTNGGVASTGSAAPATTGKPNGAEKLVSTWGALVSGIVISIVFMS